MDQPCLAYYVEFLYDLTVEHSSEAYSIDNSLISERNINDKLLVLMRHALAV
jgi:hypothetical protein